MTLPLVIEDIIMDYYEQLVISEQWDRVVAQLNDIKEYADEIERDEPYFHTDFCRLMTAMWCLLG